MSCASFVMFANHACVFFLGVGGFPCVTSAKCDLIFGLWTLTLLHSNSCKNHYFLFRWVCHMHQLLQTAYIQIPYLLYLNIPEDMHWCHFPITTSLLSCTECQHCSLGEIAKRGVKQRFTCLKAIWLKWTYQRTSGPSMWPGIWSPDCICLVSMYGRNSQISDIHAHVRKSDSRLLSNSSRDFFTPFFSCFCKLQQSSSAAFKLPSSLSFSKITLPTVRSCAYPLSGY